MVDGVSYRVVERDRPRRARRVVRWRRVVGTEAARLLAQINEASLVGLGGVGGAVAALDAGERWRAVAVVLGLDGLGALAVGIDRARRLRGALSDRFGRRVAWGEMPGGALESPEGWARRVGLVAGRDGSDTVLAGDHSPSSI